MPFRIEPAIFKFIADLMKMYTLASNSRNKVSAFDTTFCVILKLHATYISDIRTAAPGFGVILHSNSGILFPVIHASQSPPLSGLVCSFLIRTAEYLTIGCMHYQLHE